MDAENHFDNLEKERILKLNAERIELVRPYLEEVDNLSLSGMEQDVFDAYLLTKKNNYEAIVKADKEREEARLKAIEDERLEQERIRLENARLTKEAEEKEKALEVERDIARKKAEDLRKLQAAKDAKIKAEKDKLVAELKAERDAEEERIAKNNAKIIAEKNAEEERTQKELNKGDAAKVKDLLEDLEGLKTKFVFKSGKNKKMYAQVSELMDKVINHIQK